WCESGGVLHGGSGGDVPWRWRGDDEGGVGGGGVVGDGGGVGVVV
ncbi:hypothetical protein Tco_0333656, partial [Tanacetum coccineum]